MAAERAEQRHPSALAAKARAGRVALTEPLGEASRRHGIEGARQASAARAGLASFWGMVQEGRRDRRRRSSAALVGPAGLGLAACGEQPGPAALLALALALGGLAWRLAEGPLEIPFLARQIEASVNTRPGIRLEIGRAASPGRVSAAAPPRRSTSGCPM